MIHEKITLTDDKEDYLETYAPDKVDGYKGKAILVIPGGGYGCVCSEREGEPIALAFLKYGYSAFVLHYSVGKENNFPKQLTEASLAIKHIKDNAERYNIDPSEVFAVGFSAGGHLCGSLGILWKNDEVQKSIDMPYGYNKPKGVMMIYPVVSGEEFGHIDSFKNLLGSDAPTKQQLDTVSLEKHVDAESSPAFIVHTATDDLVNVRNSLTLGEAYAKAGKKFELHIYPDAPHGVALGKHPVGLIARIDVAEVAPTTQDRFSITKAPRLFDTLVDVVFNRRKTCEILFNDLSRFFARDLEPLRAHQ